MSSPATGFTLTLDGDPEEVARMLRVMGAEYNRIDLEAQRRLEVNGFFPAMVVGRTTLRGKIEMRYPLDALPDVGA